MCRPDSRVRLSAEDAVAAEESLSAYCKPVELYNILERRAVQNPSFLQRCLKYKIQEKHTRRIKMTISISWSTDKGVQVQSILPLYVLLVTPTPELAAGGHSAVYCCRTRARILNYSSESERNGCTKANFVLPEMNKLSDESKSGKLFILFVSCGDKRNSTFGGSSLSTPSYPASIGGYCLWGKIPMDSVYSSLEKCASSDGGAELHPTVDMRPCFLESSSLEKEQCVTFKTPDNPVTMQVQVNILAQKGVGKDRSPYTSFAHDSVHSSSSPHITRMRTGNVVFNYKYYNNTLQKTEVTEDFTCTFCLVKCASFEGLKHHLRASHDLFNYEFWVTEEYQAVNVSVRNDMSENLTDVLDPNRQMFLLCLKRLKRKRSPNQSQCAKHVHTCDQKLVPSEATENGLVNGHGEKEVGTNTFAMPTTTPMDAEPSNPLLTICDNDAHSSKGKDPKVSVNENDAWNQSHTAESNDTVNASAPEYLERVASSPNVTGVSTITVQSSVEPECLPIVTERNLVPPAMLQFAKTRKLSADRSDPRNRILLQKRQFFHSHRAQPMELEQVISEHDSEDEVDDDIADFEDRRMLDDFVDVTRDEKQIMHLWNSFVRKQRVLADGHIPWACEAFSRLHGKGLVQAPALLLCWRLFMVKLWNHGLLDSATMDNCSEILDNYNTGNVDTLQS